jgi:hypothetical protein
MANRRIVPQPPQAPSFSSSTDSVFRSPHSFFGFTTFKAALPSYYEEITCRKIRYDGVFRPLVTEDKDANRKSIHSRIRGVVLFSRFFAVRITITGSGKATNSRTAGAF